MQRPVVCPSEWVKINQEENGVAWGARDDSPGKWEVASRVCGRKLKLQNRSGGVNCNVNAYSNSSFGCDPSRAGSSANRIGVFVTLGKGFEYAIVPSANDPKAGIRSDKIFYSLSGYSASSNYLEFDLPLTDDESYFCFEKGTEYQLWYGEDMYDATESDNGGTAYTDIYIMN